MERIRCGKIIEKRRGAEGKGGVVGEERREVMGR